MMFTIRNGSKLQRAVAQETIDGIGGRFPLDQFVATSVEISFVADPLPTFHNEAAGTVQASENGWQIRVSKGITDEDFIADVIAHEIGHVLIGTLKLVDKAYDIAQLFRASPLTPWHSSDTDGGWAYALEEAVAETFKDIYSPVTAYKNRTKFQLPDLQSAFFEFQSLFLDQAALGYVQEEPEVLTEIKSQHKTYQNDITNDGVVYRARKTEWIDIRDLFEQWKGTGRSAMVSMRTNYEGPVYDGNGGWEPSFEVGAMGAYSEDFDGTYPFNRTTPDANAPYYDGYYEAGDRGGFSAESGVFFAGHSIALESDQSNVNFAGEIVEPGVLPTNTYLLGTVAISTQLRRDADGILIPGLTGSELESILGRYWFTSWLSVQPRAGHPGLTISAPPYRPEVPTIHFPQGGWRPVGRQRRGRR